MRINGSTPVSELYHGDDELTHWRYVKKEKLSNGKTRYYYSTDRRVLAEQMIKKGMTDKAAKEAEEKRLASEKKAAKKIESENKRKTTYDAVQNTAKYVDAATNWVEERLSLTVKQTIEALQGKIKLGTWEDHKRYVGIKDN